MSRDLPRPTTPRQQSRKAAEARWGPIRRQRDEERRETKAAARAEIGDLSDRELFLVGVALYWAEGCKDKPYDRREKATFINSDPQVVRVYLAWLKLLGVGQERWRLRVSTQAAQSEGDAEERRDRLPRLSDDQRVGEC